MNTTHEADFRPTAVPGITAEAQIESPSSWEPSRPRELNAAGLPRRDAADVFDRERMPGALGSSAIDTAPVNATSTRAAVSDRIGAGLAATGLRTQVYTAPRHLDGPERVMGRDPSEVVRDAQRIRDEAERRPIVGGHIQDDPLEAGIARLAMRATSGTTHFGRAMRSADTNTDLSPWLKPAIAQQWVGKDGSSQGKPAANEQNIMPAPKLQHDRSLWERTSRRRNIAFAMRLANMLGLRRG
ncbi:MAG TPA: hypothetical protein VLE99_04845 [Candidatus Saccharimonadales bacterium]|nr:hypothetical protein [Candidatus Saccharimonadales bacterium]